MLDDDSLDRICSDMESDEESDEEPEEESDSVEIKLATAALNCRSLATGKKGSKLNSKPVGKDARGLQAKPPKNLLATRSVFAVRRVKAITKKKKPRQRVTQATLKSLQA